MRDVIVYLDSSVIVKRYVRERGSDTVISLYRKAYSGDLRIAFSLWNIGEVLGVFDRARRLGRIGEREYIVARRRFMGETKRMIRLGILVLVPLRLRILAEAWRFIESYHVYVADALQIASAKYTGSQQFLTSDRRLHEIAVSEGLNSTLLS